MQEQVIVQDIPLVSPGERIQEQNLASAPQVVGSLLPFEEFDAPVYTTTFVRIRSLQVRRPRTHLKSQLCMNRSMLWRGYRNKLLNPSMCWHLQ